MRESHPPVRRFLPDEFDAMDDTEDVWRHKEVRGRGASGESASVGSKGMERMRAFVS